MKGERRHELEKNQLAEWLAKTFGVIVPYQNAILGAVLLVAVATVGYLWWAGQAGSTQLSASDAFQRALWKLSQGDPSPTDFEAVVDDYPDTDVALCARTMAADLHLAIGCDTLFSNKSIAKQELREAEDHYLKILGSQQAESKLRERATFGLARARESQGNLQKALEHYKAVGESWPDGAYAATAASRVEDLEKNETKLLYDRFAQFKPETLLSREPAGPDQPPAFDPDTLDENTSLFEPKLPGLEERGVEEEQPNDSTTPDETTPDETTPDETIPEETTPDETTPDETTPEETTPDETTEPPMDEGP